MKLRATASSQFLSLTILSLKGLSSTTSASYFAPKIKTTSFMHHYSMGSTTSSLCQLFSTASSDKDIFAFDLSKAEFPTLPPIPPKSKRLFLVRHGEVINPGGDRPVYYGAMDVSLSPLGEMEAKAAGAYLEQFELQHVGASPLNRAIFGATQVILRQREKLTPADLKIYPGFSELDRGAWCGKTKDEIGEEAMARFDACDESVTPEGGESYPVLKKRVLSARNEILSITECGKASAVVSHLQVTRSMLSDAMDIPTDQMAALKVTTASISCIDFDSSTGAQTIHFQSFKPDFGLSKSTDGAN
mmetsp:Transcript_8097/g.11575  ORF Transcript_8097/g.11575 Transcript_8097/m.11575 type:complete len:303 (+) Transcript_8097:111-1019(+)